MGYDHQNIDILVGHVVYLGDLFPRTPGGKLDYHIGPQFLGRRGKNLQVLIPPLNDKGPGGDGKAYYRSGRIVPGFSPPGFRRGKNLNARAPFPRGIVPPRISPAAGKEAAYQKDGKKGG
jgi:hypothetical protein